MIFNQGYPPFKTSAPWPLCFSGLSFQSKPYYILWEGYVWGSEVHNAVDYSIMELGILCARSEVNVFVRQDVSAGRECLET